MGMSTDVAPRYISVNTAGQMAYVLETTNLGQVQLAVPATEIVLIQDDKSINICDSPILVADMSSENVGWLGNNMIVLVSQPQDILVVEQEVDSSITAEAATPVYQYTTSKSSPVTASYCEVVEEEVSTTTAEDAKCWFRDSLISTAALSTLSSYVQSNGSAK